MECKWQVEIDEFNRKVLRSHWPEVRRHEDVATFPPSKADDWYVDCICGGDPCQENSNARQNTGLEQPSLGGDFIRIVDVLRPRIVVRENPSAVRADAPWPWWRFRSSLESIGYVGMPFRLRACCFGADHQRDRMLVLAVRSDTLQEGPQGDVLEALERAARSKVVCDAAGQNRRHPAPRICRAADGIPDRVDRLRALGNAIDPRVAEWIGRRIMEASAG